MVNHFFVKGLFLISVTSERICLNSPCWYVRVESAYSPSIERIIACLRLKRCFHQCKPITSYRQTVGIIMLLDLVQIRLIGIERIRRTESLRRIDRLILRNVILRCIQSFIFVWKPRSLNRCVILRIVLYVRGLQGRHQSPYYESQFENRNNCWICAAALTVFILLRRKHWSHLGALLEYRSFVHTCLLSVSLLWGVNDFVCSSLQWSRVTLMIRCHSIA